MRKLPKKAKNTVFGDLLSVGQLTELAAELKELRDHPPLVKKKNGKYEGDILGFVKGLRLSARVIYFLREHLSTTDFEVSWGHVLSDDGQRFSPECDVIIHTKGHVRKWNGTDCPVMNFVFVNSSQVRAVVSCKSLLQNLDSEYPESLRKYGVRKVFLFTETCKKSRFVRFQKRARAAGYVGLWCLYFQEKKDGSFESNEHMYVDFAARVRKAIGT